MLFTKIPIVKEYFRGYGENVIYMYMDAVHEHPLYYQYNKMSPWKPSNNGDDRNDKTPVVVHVII